MFRPITESIQQNNDHRQDFKQKIKHGVGTALVLGALLGDAKPLDAQTPADPECRAKPVPGLALSDQLKVCISQQDQETYAQEYAFISGVFDTLVKRYPYIGKFIPNVYLRPQVQYEGKPVHGLATYFQSKKTGQPETAAYLELSFQAFKTEDGYFNSNADVILEETLHLFDLNTRNELIARKLTSAQKKHLQKLRATALQQYQKDAVEKGFDPYTNPNILDPSYYPTRASKEDEVVVGGGVEWIKAQNEDLKSYFTHTLFSGVGEYNTIKVFGAYWDALFGYLELNQRK